MLAVSCSKISALTVAWHGLLPVLEVVQRLSRVVLGELVLSGVASEPRLRRCRHVHQRSLNREPSAGNLYARLDER